jgi:hypothetical protein
MAEVLLALDTMPAELFNWYLFVLSFFVWVFTRIEGIPQREPESRQWHLDDYDDCYNFRGGCREPAFQRPESDAACRVLAEQSNISGEAIR